MAGIRRKAGDFDYRGQAMTTLELDNETTALLAEMAAQEHTTLAQLANRLLTECLED